MARRKEPTSTTFWGRFQTQVMEPYIDGLIKHLELRFQQLGTLGAFSIFGARLQDTTAFEYLKMLAQQFRTINEREVLQEWQSFNVLVTSGIMKDKSQLEVLQLMASGYEELHLLYPNLSLLAAIALTIPVSI
ncbi:uncharacterized protein V3H82_003137 [Fundulus diaphanus]